MKAGKARISGGLNVGRKIAFIDNSGAKVLEIISVFGYKGSRRRHPFAGVARMIKVTVKEGDVKEAERKMLSHLKYLEGYQTREHSHDVVY